MNSNNYFQTVRINFDKVLCDNYLGMSAVYHAFAFSQEYECRGYTDADRAAEFELIKSVRPGVVRSYFYPHYNCSDIYGPYDMKCPRMESVRKWCAKMKELGIDVAMQAGWHFPSNTYFGHSSSSPDIDPEKFAQWVEVTMSYLINDCGLNNVKYLILFTEPTSYITGNLPEGWTQWQYYVRVVKAISTEFNRTGLRSKMAFVGPNNTFGGVHSDYRYKIEDGGTGGTNLAEAVRDLDDCIDIYSAHDYNFLHQEMWENMCKNMAAVTASTGKPFWLDEYGMQPEILRTSAIYGNFIAQIQTASMAAGHQTTMIWSLFDQLFPSSTPLSIPEGDDCGSHGYNRDSFHDGVHRCGVYSFARDDYEDCGGPYDSWYAYKLLSQALGGNANDVTRSICECTHALTLYGGAMKQGSEYTIIVVNTNATPAQLRLECGLADGVKLYRKVFAPFSSLPVMGSEAAPTVHIIVDGAIEDILPKSGFSIYTTRERL